MKTSHHGAINVAPRYFQQIRDGLKTVEGRIAKEKFCALQAGQTLTFCCEDDKLLTRIIEIKKFPTFKHLLEHYGLKTCLPDLNCLEEGVKIYHSFPNYKQQESELGVIGIQIERMGNNNE
jgi:ASC-1-like (ASCH) protein